MTAIHATFARQAVYVLILLFVIQVAAIESANLNQQTMQAMKKGADALKGIHGSLYVAMLLFRNIYPIRCAVVIAKLKHLPVSFQQYQQGRSDDGFYSRAAGCVRYQYVHDSLNLDLADFGLIRVFVFYTDLTNEISDAISNPHNMGVDLDEVSSPWLEMVLFDVTSEC